MRSLLTIAALIIVSLTVSDRAAGAENVSDISIRTSPYKILQKAAKLLPPSDKPVVSAPEDVLFADAADGLVDSMTLDNAVMICAGVTDAETRDHYVKKLNAIVKKARKAIAKGKTDNEKADLLAHHLYEGPLHGGYDGGQSELLKLLDEGTFNCVSSAMLYNVVASELGLETNCVNLPNHVFLMMGDLAIEPAAGTTCSHLQHSALVNQCWNQSTEYLKRYYDDSHMYVSSNVDLMATTYMNRSLDLQVDQPAKAAIEALKAVCLDSKNPRFRQNAEGQLAVWFQSAINQHDVKLAGKIAKLYGEFFAHPSQASTMQRAIAQAQAKQG